jgi:hypothetical protein
MVLTSAGESDRESLSLLEVRLLELEREEEEAEEEEES